MPGITTSQRLPRTLTRHPDRTGPKVFQMSQKPAHSLEDQTMRCSANLCAW